MTSPGSGAEAGAWARDPRQGPLPLLLVVLTVVTGLVDAISYLKLGHVFVANMTGNVVLLGFAVAGNAEFSVAVSVVAIGAFLVGALAGGRLASTVGRHRGRLLALSADAQVGAVVAAFVVTLASPDGAALRAHATAALLAFAMGLQNATARRLGVPDLTTTVLTLTVTGLAADSRFAGGTNPNVVRRLVAILAMFAGAWLGAIVVLHVGVAAALGLAVALLSVVALVGYRLSSSPAAWTAAS